VGLPDYRAQIVQHTLQIVAHLVVPIADDAISLVFKEGGAAAIPLVLAMLPAIDLNDQIELATQEVANERTNRHLAREFPTVELPLVELAPQESFGRRRIVAKLLGPSSGSSQWLGHILSMPSPDPSRKAGGEF